MKNLDYIPRRFLLANELSDTNFTSYYSCNKRAFTRLIIDAFSLFTEGGGINKNAAPLFYSEIARGKNLNIFARAVKYVRLSRALRKKRWDFREKRTFFKLTRASLRLGLAIMRSKFIFKKE